MDAQNGRTALSDNNAGDDENGIERNEEEALCKLARLERGLIMLEQYLQEHDPEALQETTTRMANAVAQA
eukprot:gene55-79_t